MAHINQDNYSDFLTQFTESLIWQASDEVFECELSCQFIGKVVEIIDTIFKNEILISIIDNYADYYTYSDFAHSMALTINRHGAGLMDLHFQHSDHKNILTDFCGKIGEIEIYIGDDNLLYIA